MSLDRRSLAAAAVVLSMTLAGCAGSTEGVFGADLYQQSCARCHGAAGEGGIGGPIGAGTEAAGYQDSQIGDIIRVGPGRMPGFPGFSDQQIDSVVEHLRMLQAASP